MPFPIVTKNDISEKLKKVGVQRGDIIYVASFISILGNSPTILSDTINALIEVVGEEGTVVMPVFNWDYCSGAVFDPIAAPSQVGVLTEAFRKHAGVLRSITPPWCTFAAIGQKAKEVIEIKGTSPFGPDSITQYLYDINARYVLIGCNYNDAVIHLHWLEEKFEVPYRFWKRFIGQVKINNKLVNNISYMYARRLDINTEIDSRHITDKFDRTDKVKVEKLGLGELRGFMAKDYVEFVSPYFERDRLIVLPPEGRKAFQ
jgi:aminoglycoside 3-N-acetyltransferase